MHTSLHWRVFFAVAATFLAAQAPAQPRFTFDTTPGQLGKDVVPSEYRLALNLDPARATFAGAVDIALRVRRPVEGIVLNAFDLTAGEIVLTGPGGARPMTATDDRNRPRATRCEPSHKNGRPKHRTQVKRAVDRSRPPPATA